mmetsp:Transcript_31465/g.76771  ORF Transcript_31465/g.76771 Transcript_31465/m.76771 type:complete len:343 (-) Transcript_31465:249-1277(-)|eukprot:CAMPEP_0114518530 /NCGR_PEP_ID=MMETSP0109-20121206/18495_1 /TAXON_ID=29199 /ORGANISM="Chlorarachnion reptans, Strain CCCM449" /LENGTH=342 /DNA_ID=CAMNT_0001699161 /DNA_START=353 /DNA_END=1381 /DNA_ORIENTATION=-
MPNKYPAAKRLYYDVTSTTVINAGMGILFSIAFFVVFIPQHIECYKRKSCAGLSPWLLLLGGISFMFAFFNVLLMDIGTLGACSGDEKYDPEAINCIAVASPILQQMLPAITGYPSWYIWFHLYCPDVLWTQHLISLSIFLTCSTIGAGISLYVLFLRDQALIHFVGVIWGIIATITNFVMWFPQIETTIRIKSRGALSVSMLVSTIISDILFTLYLCILANQHWSVWLPQVPDAFQQMLLLALLWHFGDLGTEQPNPIYEPMLSKSTIADTFVACTSTCAGKNGRNFREESDMEYSNGYQPVEEISVKYPCGNGYQMEAVVAEKCERNAHGVIDHEPLERI